MTNTLKSTTHDINTAFELSGESYFESVPPLQGSDQHNGIEPTIWVMISANFKMIMRDEGYG